ncbi:MAG: EAL domain-containing protein [Pseudomonadota bacterium]
MWRYSELQQAEHLNKEFKFASGQVANNIHSRIEGYETVMRGIRGYFQASENVSFSEFKQYVKDLHIDKKKTGIQGIGIVERIPHAQKNQHIEYVRKWQLKDYRIKPQGNRDFYAPIVRMEPMLDDNLNAIGFDVFTVPSARLAMGKSVDVDNITITSPISLVQDKGKANSLAFVMYLPIYAKNQVLDSVLQRRTAVNAWIDVPFRINDLMAGLKGEFANDIIVEIYDGASPSNQSRMYQSENSLIQNYTSDNFLSGAKQLSIGGRTWTLLTKTTPAFKSRVSSSSQSMIIAFAGCVLSFLIAWITYLLVGGRQKAQTRYKRLFAQANEGVIILNSNHRIVDCNQAATHMFGYSNAELLHLHLHQILAKSEMNVLRDFLSELDNLSVESSSLKEWLHVCKNGTQFSAEVSFSKLDAENYFMVVRDLSERKKAEQQIQRLNRLYLALSETNQAIVRMDDEKDLFPLVCKCAVELGNMKMAWIGEIDGSLSKINPVVSYATDPDCLEILRFPETSQPLNNHRLADDVFSDNNPVIINNLLDQPDEVSWHMQAKKFGWRSLASFPIQRNGKAFALLTVYHDLINVFDKEVVGLLTEMSNDISFALDNFDRENQRLQSQQLLAESEEKLSIILDNVAAHIYLKDINGRYLFANQQVLNLWGAKPEEVIGFGDEKFFDAETTQLIRESDRKVLVGGEIVEQEEANEVKETGDVNVYWSVKIPLRRENGSIYGLCGISTDITQQKIIEADLRIAAISFESQVGMMITDANKIALKVNNAYKKISGYSAEEVINLMPMLASPNHYDADFLNQIWSDSVHNGGWEGELTNQRRNGEIYLQYVIVTAVKDADQYISNYVISFTDITESKAAARKIEHLAFFDPLTQLPNRRLLLDRLSHALMVSQRSELIGALLYLDLDHFKIVNDSRGHAIGDILLKQVADRLIACVRADDTVARLGGDEYVIMLESLSKEPLEAATQTELIAQKIQRALNEPYQLASHQSSITTSIGLVLFDSQNQAPDELLKQADIAMYHAKKSGRNAFHFFDPDMQNTINLRVLLEEELNQALAMQQFKLHYQVQVDGLGNAIGAEALIRWQHPTRGSISPFEFITLAEETGLILPIGEWVLNEACRQIKRWGNHEATKHLSISINVSTKQFHQTDFVEQVKAAVTSHKIPAGLLKLELTESMLIDNIENIIGAMNSLKAVGVRFELDDFGTGYSSLQYLKRLPLHQLKIDQSFVREITTDKSDKAIVKTIIKMAQGLGLAVIAEGVETQEQLQQLQKIGCAYFQGYLFGKPLPIEDIEQLLNNQQSFKNVFLRQSKR